MSPPSPSRAHRHASSTRARAQVYKDRYAALKQAADAQNATATASLAVPPKRPFSSFMFFSLAQKIPAGTTFADRARLLGEKWRGLSADDRVPVRCLTARPPRPSPRMLTRPPQFMLQAARAETKYKDDIAGTRGAALVECRGEGEWRETHAPPPVSFPRRAEFERTVGAERMAQLKAHAAAVRTISAKKTKAAAAVRGVVRGAVLALAGPPHVAPAGRRLTARRRVRPRYSPVLVGCYAARRRDSPARTPPI